MTRATAATMAAMGSACIGAGFAGVVLVVGTVTLGVVGVVLPEAVPVLSATVGAGEPMVGAG